MGYVKRPTLTDLPCFLAFSLNWIIGSNQFMGVTQLRSQQNSAWAGTWDWTKIIYLVGSIPKGWGRFVLLGAEKSVNSIRECISVQTICKPHMFQVGDTEVQFQRKA
jgi:hypothetical protein